jgi:hypothetical protein
MLPSVFADSDGTLDSPSPLRAIRPDVPAPFDSRVVVVDTEISGTTPNHAGGAVVGGRAMIGCITARLSGDDRTFSLPAEIDLFANWVDEQRQYANNTAVFDKCRMWVMSHIRHVWNTDTADPYTEGMSVEVRWFDDDHSRVSVVHVLTDEPDDDPIWFLERDK